MLFLNNSNKVSNFGSLQIHLHTKNTASFLFKPIALFSASITIRIISAFSCIWNRSNTSSVIPDKPNSTLDTRTLLNNSKFGSNINKLLPSSTSKTFFIASNIATYSSSSPDSTICSSAVLPSSFLDFNNTLMSSIVNSIHFNFSSRLFSNIPSLLPCINFNFVLSFSSAILPTSLRYFINGSIWNTLFPTPKSFTTSFN